MSTPTKAVEAEVVDIHEWDHEESTKKREEEKDKMTELIKTSVIANKGNV